MFKLGEEIIYKRYIGVIIDIENQLIFNGNHKIQVDFSKSKLTDYSFDSEEELLMYLSFMDDIHEDIIDGR